MPKSVSTRSAYKMLTCIYLCRTLLFFAPYADFLLKNGLFDTSYRICADYELLVRNGKFLDVAFYPSPVIQMQGGGLSFSYLCQWETFRIRKSHKTVGMLYNYYLLFRGCVGLTVKKIRWNV